MSTFANWKDVTPEVRREFESIFKTPLEPYWDKSAPFLGFDIVKFEDQFIKPPDGMSIKDVVKAKYGAAGVALIKRLL